MRFEWDTGKSEINLKRHRVSFEEAVAAFFDSDAVDDYDPEHSVCGRRYNLIGLSGRRLLFVVYIEPEDSLIRIVSARKAEKKHRRIYEQKE